MSSIQKCYPPFPTRIIGNQDDSADNNYQQQQHQRRNSTQSERSTRSGKALENATALASASNPSRRASLAATVAARTSGDLSDAMCVICLDEFSAGETVRQLPCGHEYHCECIDPWLTVKSASCPLCKHDCSLDIPGNTEQTENDGTTSSNENPTQQQQQLQPPPPAAFGPTMSPEQIEALNQSWVLRTLPRTMRRQIREAAATNDGGSTMVLPARMTQDNPIQVQEQQDPSPRDTSFAGRLVRSLPTRWQRR